MGTTLSRRALSLTAGLTMMAAVLAGCESAAPVAETHSDNGVVRTHDGRPDLNGIWQTFNTANWNI